MNSKIIKYCKFILIIFLFSSFSFSQAQTPDVKSLSNSELDELRKQFQKDEIGKINDVSLDVEVQENIMESEKNEEQDIENNFEKKIISDDQIESSYFGYNYFEGEYNFFDNIPVPKNYLLRPRR